MRHGSGKLRWLASDGLWKATDGRCLGYGVTRDEACAALEKSATMAQTSAEPGNATKPVGKHKSNAGRPPQHGEQLGWMLVRNTLIVAGYERRRQAGGSHAESVHAAIREVEHGMGVEVPISDATVRRALAEWFSTLPDRATLHVTGPRSEGGRKVYTAAFGKRPKFLRKPRRRFDFTSKARKT